MFPAFAALLEGLALGLAALALHSATLPAGAGGSGLALFPLCLGLGLLFGARPRADERAAHAAFPRAAAALFAVTAAAGAWVAGLEQHGRFDLLAFALLAACAGCAAAGLLRALVRFCGVQKTRRLPLAAAALAGAACGAPLRELALGRGVSELAVLSVAAAVLVLASLLPGARRAITAVPRHDPWTTGLGTTAGAFAVGLGGAGLLATVAAFVEGAGLAARAAWFQGFLLAAFAAGAVLLPIIHPRVRRAGALLGATALLAAGAAAAAGAGLAAEPPAALSACIRDFWDLSGGGGGWRDGVVALTLLGLPFLLLGFGLAGIVRLHARLPSGGKIMVALPVEERRPPSGAAQRLGAALLGLTVGLPLLAPGLASPNWPVAAATLGTLAGGGILLVLFDPRAGAGRKLMLLAATGAAAAAGFAFWCRGVPLW